MLSTRIMNRCLVRTFTRSVVRRNLDKPKTPETTSTSATTTTQTQEPSIGTQDLVHDFVPSTMDKRFLLWAGKYKRPEDIPRRVSISIMNAAKSKLRIKMATVLMIMVLVGCYVITRIGKSKASKGDTLQSRQRERERKIREEGRKALLSEKAE